jgi:hypothetical protein
VSLKITGYFFFIMSTNIPTVSLSNQISCHALLACIIHEAVIDGGARAFHRR